MNQRQRQNCQRCFRGKMDKKQEKPRNGLRLVHSQDDAAIREATRGPKSALAKELNQFADQLDAYIYSVLSQ